MSSPEYFKEYYQKHKEILKARANAYYRNNRLAKLQYAKKYREQNKETVALAKALWVKAHRTYLNQKRRNDPKAKIWSKKSRISRDRRLKEGYISFVDWLGLIEYFENKCVYCNKIPDGTIEMDHVIPIAKGGDHVLGNILPTCRSCNSKKHTKNLEEFDPAYKKYMEALA